MSDFYQVSEWENGYFRIFSPAGVYMDLFVGSEKALLLDTGYGFGDLRSVVKGITSLPLIIVNTHGHVDHACGNGQFEEDIFIHPADMDLCAEHNGRVLRGRALSMARNFEDPETGKIRNILPQDFDEDVFYHSGTGHLVPLADGQRFDLGGIILKVIHVPGHTKGSIGLMDEGKKIFYSGDSMNFSTWLFLPEAENVSVYAESIRKMLGTEFERIMFSHADSPYPKAVLADFLDLAEHVDYEKGYPFSAPLVPGAVAKYCCREGYQPEDMFRKPGYAAIVIGPDKL